MNKEYEYVKEFHKVFGYPISESPVLLTEDRAKIRYNWMLERLNKFLEAVKKQDIVEQANAIIDTIYFALGTLVEMGIMPDMLFEIVQKANMSKLWSDGKPHYNEMGKVIKSSDWEDPHPKLKLAIHSMQNCTPDNCKEASYTINYQYNEVKSFHKAFGHPSSKSPVLLTKDRAKARYNWMLEEINEFLEAAKEQDIVEQADAMIDAIYFALGTLVEMGITPGILFKIVQKANIEKLWADGKPHYNEMGEVINPEGWEEPYQKLKRAIIRMIY